MKFFIVDIKLSNDIKLWEGRTKTMEEIKVSVDCRVSFVLKAQIAVDPNHE